jgi:hypothetical protein
MLRPTVLDIPELILRHAAHTASPDTAGAIRRLRRDRGQPAWQGRLPGPGRGPDRPDPMARELSVCSIDITCGAGDLKDLTIGLKAVTEL